MENNHENGTFHYTYSAKEQSEVQRIRKKYLPRDEDKMERLRRLDRSVRNKGLAVALTLGIVGALLLGVGMCLCLVWEQYIPGIVIGGVGILIVALAYPVKNLVIKKAGKKIAPEILRLTDELMK